MDPIPLRTVIQQVGGCWQGPGEPPAAPVVDVSTDSRTILPESLFVALKGDRFDGRKFIPEAMARGALAVLVESEGSPVNLAGMPLIDVPDTLKALERLAVYSSGRNRAERIAITGTVGKTTTKEFIGTILARQFSTVRAPKSYNNRIGVSHTLLLANRETRFIVSEVGTSAPGELEHLSCLVNPSRVVITEIGQAHLAGFGDLEGVIQAKAEVFAGMSPGGTSFIQEAVPGREELARAARKAGSRVVLYGWERGDFRITACRRLTFGDPDLSSGLPPTGSLPPMGFSFRAMDPAGREEEFCLRLPGRHNVLNALAAVALARDVGLDWEEIRGGIEDLRLPPLRFDLRRIGGVVVIDDTYNASHSSVLSALKEAGEIPLPPGGRRFLVLGDLLELGQKSREIHQEIGREVARNRRFAGLITVGIESRAAAQGAADTEEGFFLSLATLSRVEEAAPYLEGILAPGDLVLLKASRGVGLERAADELRERLGMLGDDGSVIQAHGSKAVNQLEGGLTKCSSISIS